MGKHGCNNRNNGECHSYSRGEILAHGIDLEQIPQKVQAARTCSRNHGTLSLTGSPSGPIA